MMSVSRKRFLHCSDGAVTIDWVALTATILIVSVSILPLFVSELQALTNVVDRKLDEADDISLSDPG